MTYISFKYRWTWEVSHCTNTDCLLLYAISLIKQWFWILRCLFGYFFSPFLHISPWKKGGDTRFNRLEQSALRSITTRPGHISLPLSPCFSCAHSNFNSAPKHKPKNTLSLYNILLCDFLSCAPCGRCRDQDRAAEQPQLPINFTGNWWPAKASPYSASLITQLTVTITGILKALFKNHSVRKIRLREL